MNEVIAPSLYKCDFLALCRIHKSLPSLLRNVALKGTVLKLTFQCVSFMRRLITFEK